MSKLRDNKLQLQDIRKKNKSMADSNSFLYQAYSKVNIYLFELFKKLGIIHTYRIYFYMSKSLLPNYDCNILYIG